jgi:hypothetical protein
MMKLLVHGLGAWFAVEAASGRYPRPVAVGLTMLVTRLGAPAMALAMAGYGLKRLQEAGAFEGWPGKPAAPRRRTPAKVQQRNRRGTRTSGIG